MQKSIINYLLCAAAWLFCLLMLFPAVSADEAEGLFHVVKEPEEIRRGSSFSVVLSPAESALSAFVLFAEYDPTDIVQDKVVFSENLRDAYIYASEQDGRLAVVYTAKNSRSLPENGTLTLTFRTSADSLMETLPLRISVMDAAAADASPLLDEPESLELEVPFAPDPASDSSLLSLTPPVGTLVPPFDPEILEYTLDVPFSSASLVFDAIPADGATVRVNRKNLGAGGSTVDFSFTVTAEDGVTKSVYTVSVTRLTKISAPSTAAGSSGTSGSHSASAGSTGEASSADTGGTDDLPAQSGSTLPTGVVDTVYVSSGTVPYDTRADRFETMAIVLISVGAGMGFVVFVQRFGKPHDPNDEDK